MTDDSYLFIEPGADEPAADTDLALITAYLARELSLDRMLAVEDRLATDTQFRATAQPILDVWALPHAAAVSTTPRGPNAPLLSRTERAAAWERYNQTEHATELAVTGRRWTPPARIAAAIVLMALPLLGLAQAVAYLAREWHAASAPVSRNDGEGSASPARPGPAIAPGESGAARDGALSLEGPSTAPLTRVAAPARHVTAKQRDTIVKMAGAPRYPGISKLTQELSIGAVSGPDAYTLGNIVEMAVARDGSIFALDRSTSTIRMYDAAGRHIRNIGRRGQGPGDLSNPAGLAALPDGRLLVWDAQLMRVSVFGPNGASVAEWPGSGTATMGGSHGLVLDSAGFAYARQASIVRGVPLAPREAPPIRKTWLKFRTSDGALLDSIVEPDMPPFAQPFRAERQGGGFRQMAMPFAPRRITTLSPLGYIVSGIAERYAFEIRPSGRGVVSVRRDLAATPIPARARDSARANIESMMRETDPLWAWPGRELPRVMPYYVEILVGLDGRIWLQRDKSQPPAISAPSPAMRGRTGASAATRPDPNVDFTYAATHFDVFEPSGAFIGQVEMPAKVTPMVMRGDYVWAVAKDDDDVQFVKRYRIAWK